MATKKGSDPDDIASIAGDYMASLPEEYRKIVRAKTRLLVKKIEQATTREELHAALMEYIAFLKETNNAMDIREGRE